jgi:hypothetical protein
MVHGPAISASPSTTQWYRPESFATTLLSVAFLILLPLIQIVDAGRVMLAWDPSPSSDILGYRVYVGVASRSYSESIDVGNSTTHTFQSIDNTKTHYFAVRAYNHTGESGFSNEVTYRSEAPSSTYFDAVQKLYIGYYQRPADPEGLIFWANGLATIDANRDGNLVDDNIVPVLTQFTYSVEARDSYGGDITSSNIATVIDSIYVGLFGRHTDADGLVWWVDSFNSGASTPATILWEIMNGAQSTDKPTLDNRLIAATRFTRVVDPNLDGQPPFARRYTGYEDFAKAEQRLAGVTWDPATIPTEDEIRALLPSP